MATKRISMACEKGGVGKSTTSINVADTLVYFKMKVLLVDCDGQGNIAQRYNIPLEFSEDNNMFHLMKGQKNIRECIYHTESGLDVICGTRDYDILQKFLWGNEEASSILNNALNEVEEEYDYIIIDTPPAKSIMLENAIVASTGTVIVTEPEDFSSQGIVHFMDTVKRYSEDNEDFEIYGVLVNKNVANTTRCKNYENVYEALRQYVNVYKETISRSEDISKAQILKKSIYENKSAIKTQAEYVKFVGRLIFEKEM